MDDPSQDTAPSPAPDQKSEETLPETPAAAESVPEPTPETPTEPGIGNAQVSSGQPAAEPANQGASSVVTSKPAGFLQRLPFNLTSKLTLLIAGAVLLLLAGSGGALYWRVASTSRPAPANKTATTQSSSNNSAATSDQTSTTSDSTSDETFTPTKTISGIVLLAKPVQLDNLHFFANYNAFFSSGCADSSCSKNVPSVSDSNVSYYQIGTTSDGHRVINVSVYDSGGVAGTTYNFVVIETSSGHFTLYAVPSRIRTVDIDGLKPVLSPDLTIDTTTSIAELAIPSTITISSYASKNAHASLSLVHETYSLQFEPTGKVMLPAFYAGRQSNVRPIAFGASGDKVAYEFNLSGDANYQVMLWMVSVHNLYSVEYSPSNPLDVANPSTTSPIAITWLSGTNSRAFYESQVATGCGYPDGYSTLPAAFDTTSLTKAGTTPVGNGVYELNSSSPLLQGLYDDYKSGGDFIDTASLKNLSLDQFQAAHTVVVTQNAAGEYVIYMRAEMFQRGGCGKPVIYLYPQQPSYVNVAVDAKIVKSAPTYPNQTGWEQVLAHPNGQLVYQGKTYPSLYWEGYGYGQYPAIASGTVVPTFLAQATIREQLAEQGLTTSETNDFLAYWASKLPTAPYTRLTWLTTAQMNTLAPLHIAPKPSTLIRVFLDFQGLDQPETIPAQHFQAPARDGFTVVEWGGLLRGGIK